MNEAWSWWLLLVGIGIGVAAAWLVLPSLPGEDTTSTDQERRALAARISRVIGARGGVAPQPLVEEVLDLYAAYREDPAALPEPGAVGGVRQNVTRR